MSNLSDQKNSSSQLRLVEQHTLGLEALTGGPKLLEFAEPELFFIPRQFFPQRGNFQLAGIKQG